MAFLRLAERILRQGSWMGLRCLALLCSNCKDNEAGRTLCAALQPAAAAFQEHRKRANCQHVTQNCCSEGASKVAPGKKFVPG